MYENVRVPAANLLLGEGRGFEIAQGRLGPGRIHHCMRLIGCAQRALELMCRRATLRSAFGRALGEHGSVREDIAHSFNDIEQARLLTLRAADKMDREGNKAARDLIAAAKIVVPAMAARVIDRAMQVFGGAGVSRTPSSPRPTPTRALHAHGRRPRPGAPVGAGQGLDQAPWHAGHAGQCPGAAARALQRVAVPMNAPMKAFDLHGQVALVTGSTMGIGEATARVLARSGAHVIVSSRKQADCDRVAAELRAEGLSAEGAPATSAAWRTSRRWPNTCAARTGGSMCW